MSVLITFVAINNEEMLKEDFASKYFLEFKTVAKRTNPPFQFYFLGVPPFAQEIAETEEYFREIHH